MKVGDKVKLTSSGEELVSDVLNVFIHDNLPIIGTLVEKIDGWFVFRGDDDRYANPHNALGVWYLYSEDIEEV